MALQPANPLSRPWFAALCLCVGVLLAYANSLRAPFLFDDSGAVVENPTIRRLWSLDVLNPPADGSTTTGRPVTNLSFALNHALSGENTWSYHALNVAIHALAALALFGLVRRTLFRSGCGFQPQNHRLEADATWLAFLVALLWALHPLQTESVVCVAQRTESLCGLFFLITLYGFVRGAEPGAASGRWFAVSVAAALLGMGTKEVMVTAPVIVLLYDRTFISGSFGAAWRRHGRYYAALAATWLLLAWLVVRGGGARGPSAGFGLGISWWTYLLKQCEALVLYLKLSFWPHPLVLDYGTAVASSVGEVWREGVVVLALLGATAWALVRRPALGFAGAWFFLILAPSSSVVPLVTQTMAEHRMYLPLASILAVVVLAAYARFGRRVAWPLGIVALACAAATIARNHAYRDVVAIWTDNVTSYPSSARGHNNLAEALHRQGNDAAANAHFARALELQPDYVAAHYDWGTALLQQNRLADAVAQFEAALRLAPQHVDAHVNLGNALARLDRGAEALPHYEAALRLKPGPDVRFNFGVTLAILGRDAEAAAQLRAALEGRPGLAETHYRLGRVEENMGDAASAERRYLEAVRLAPDHAAAHARLGLLLARAERLPGAAEHLRAAVRLQPDDADAQANLGNVLLLQGQPREAIAHYEAALRLRPDDARTRENIRLAREALR